MDRQKTVVTAKVTMAAAKAQQLYRSIQTWPHWAEIGLCFQKENSLSLEEYYRRLPEYQKFLALCCVYDHIGMISPKIDALWHAHILNTALYSTFCVEFNGSFLHHLPCSSYSLYGISDEAFLENECTSCKKPICSIKPSCYEGEIVSIEEMRRSILISASEFRRAYQESFGDLPAVWRADCLQ